MGGGGKGEFRVGEGQQIEARERGGGVAWR